MTILSCYEVSPGVFRDVTLEAANVAFNNGELRERITAAIINNTQQSSTLLNDPVYFANVKQNFLPTIQDVVILAKKVATGEKILYSRDTAFQLTLKAIPIACAGVTSLNPQTGQQSSRALLPVFLDENGQLEPISDEAILAMVTEFSNSPIYFQILDNQGFV
jgi:hypothetical protein